MWQELIVACIVGAAVAHASTKYLPLAARRAIVAVLVRCGASQARMDAWFKTVACGTGCASCGSCGSDKAAPLSAQGKDDPAKRVIKLRSINSTH